jgi:prepilin-type processing-associated H-X9-DG protein
VLLLSWGNCAPPVTAQGGVWVTVGFFEVHSSLQTVEVHTPRESYSAVFQSEARVFFPNGAARGFLTLSPTDAGHPGGVNMIFVDGSVRFIRDTVAGILLQGHTEDGNPIVVMITPSATEDCLIYTTIGVDVHATWEAEGSLRVIPN